MLVRAARHMLIIVTEHQRNNSGQSRIVLWGAQISEQWDRRKVKLTLTHGVRGRMHQLGMLMALATVTAGSALASASELSAQSLSILGVQAGGSTTLDEVLVRFGKTDRWHSGDASESAHKICYRIANHSDEVILVFGSAGGMASPKGQVTSIHLFSHTAAYPQRARCAQMTNQRASLAVENGLALGMSQARVKSLFKQKATTTRGALRYESCKQRYIAESDPAFKSWVGKTQCFKDSRRPVFDDCASVNIEFSGDRASSIRLNGIQSVC